MRKVKRMNAMSRPLATLAAAAVGGAGLWLAGHWDTTGNGGYWAMLGVVALVGLLLGVSQLRAPDGNALGMLLVAWLPITIVAGWVLVIAQPDPNPFRDHVLAWNGDLGLADVAHYLSPFAAVLALGIGLVTGLTLLTAWAMRRARRRRRRESGARRSRSRGPCPRRTARSPARGGACSSCRDRGPRVAAGAAAALGAAQPPKKTR